MRQSSVLQQAWRTRVKLQRINDLKMFHGKVDAIDEKHCIVLVKEADRKFGPTDRFMIEIHGPKHKILATGVTSLVKSDSIKIELSGDMKILPVSEKPRFLAKGFKCSLVTAEGDKLSGTVDDISYEGIGLILPDEVEVGSTINVLVTHRNQAVEVAGTVKYCREFNDGIGSLRIGCTLHPLERLDAAVWQSWCEKVQNPNAA